jgi:hypothetical protein
MFTFSSGFEAAILKIPNKDYTAYGSPSGTTSTAPSGLPLRGGQPPRKEIIGFAKFRTRQEALEARDLLQGRCIDIEKGAILKAKMAKKNLHTKRGVQGMGATTSGGGVASSFLPESFQLRHPFVISNILVYHLLS